MRRIPEPLTILIVHEDGVALAQCLEFDIVAHGSSIEDALQRWADTFGGQILVDLEAGREPLEGIGPAPERYFEMFRRAKRLEREPIPLPEGVPEPWTAAASRPELRAF